MSTHQNDEVLEAKHEQDIERGILHAYDLKPDALIYGAISDGSKFMRYKYHDGKVCVFRSEKGTMYVYPIETVFGEHSNGYWIRAL